MPNNGDTEGISVFRENFTTPDEIDLATEKPGEYFIARLRVYDLNKLGLTVVPDPLKGQPQGHALIPELRLAEYKSKRNWAIETQKSMADLAQVIHNPS